VAKADGDPTGLRDTMVFDRAGNVNIQAVTFLTVEPTTNRLTSYKKSGHFYRYGYDRAGNLTGLLDSVMGQAGPINWVYGYDGLERLVSVYKDADSIARYGYDVLGRRIVKNVYSNITGGTVAYTRFVYHGDQVAFETDAAGTIGLRYTWGPGTDNLLAVRNAAGTIHAYAVPDRLGSVRGLVKRDGTVLYAFTYRPYGELADSAGSGGLELRYRWTGREYDAETGWYFHRSRYYDPKARRFVQEDPIGYAGGRNVYAYVSGRVLERTDPSGLNEAVPFRVELTPFCTSGGSLVHADGHITSDSCPSAGGAGRDAAAWAERAYDRMDAWAAYKEYNEAFKENQAKAAVPSNTNQASALATVYLNASALGWTAFGAVYASLKGMDAQLAGRIKIQLQSGNVFINSKMVEAINASKGLNAFGWTSAPFQITILHERALTDPAWAVAHETLHLRPEYTIPPGASTTQIEGIEGRINMWLRSEFGRSPQGLNVCWGVGCT